MVKRNRLRKAGSSKKKISRLKRQKNYIDRFKGQTITSSRYHSWEVTDDGKTRLTLGNLTDAGWYWDGTEDDMVGYLVRLSRSRVKDNFLKEIKDKVNFNEIKPQLLKNIKEDNDGLYQVSGDNSNWHFGQTFEIDTDIFKDRLMEGNPDLTEEEADKILDDAFTYQEVSYDEFEKEYADVYKKDMEKIIEKSNSFNEFFDAINAEAFTEEWFERTYLEYYEGTYIKAVDKALEEFRKKKK